MNVYTKTGDGGQTSLLSKQRVEKDHLRVQAYGTVDEANAAMGLAKSLLNKQWAAIIQPIQEELVSLNADLASDAAAVLDKPRILPAHAERLERVIDSLELRRIPQPYFVTPGAIPASAALDLARTIVRRAERRTVALSHAETVPVAIQLYLNRLSDLLYVLARCVEQEEMIVAAVSKAAGLLPIVKPPAGMLERAKFALAAAEAKAAEIGVPMVIAVVDAGGNLVAQQRMDGALLASISLALDKAYTAAALNMSTEAAAALSGPGQSLYGLNTACGGRLIVFGGGVPLTAGGRSDGGLGVSGGTVDQDIAVAKAGLAAWSAAV
ncbi:MAG: cob(I)yrinic acid a,c-diamide adenosyltransferase [Sporomusaceae bacterium]|nr:cob(I)yrinic acid a,c-diamide adenosyltransferase [Sporomusaceae bacterium]